MRDLSTITNQMGETTARRLNDGAPIERHRTGCILITFDFGPNQQAHYSSNVDAVTALKVLKLLAVEMERRTQNKTVHNGTLIVP